MERNEHFMSLMSSFQMSNPTGNDDAANHGSGGRAFDRTMSRRLFHSSAPLFQRWLKRTDLQTPDHD